MFIHRLPDKVGEMLWSWVSCWTLCLHRDRWKLTAFQQNSLNHFAQWSSCFCFNWAWNFFHDHFHAFQVSEHIPRKILVLDREQLRHFKCFDAQMSYGCDSQVYVVSKNCIIWFIWKGSMWSSSSLFLCTSTVYLMLHNVAQNRQCCYVFIDLTAKSNAVCMLLTVIYNLSCTVMSLKAV